VAVESRFSLQCIADNFSGTLVAGRQIKVGRLIGGSLIEVRLYIRFVFRLFSRTLFGRKDTTISSLPMALHLNTMPLTRMSDKLVLKC